MKHRLKPDKLLNIIALSEKPLGITDAEIEVEYQGQDTIGKYSLEFDGQHFVLVGTATTYLAQDKCGIPAEALPATIGKPKLKLADLQNASGCCTPNSGGLLFLLNN